ncbi:MAG TPA: hypothetical protein VGG74_35805 [Kofleriaceae bacterium]|jgi:hypothetical protein
MKLFVLAFGVLGLALELTHFAVFKQLVHHPLADHALGLVMIAGFALPILVALLDMNRPLAAWPYMIAAAGFIAVFVRLRMWDEISRFADLALRDKLYFAATVGGALVAALAARRR